MTPEQARAVSALAEALTECENLGLPMVHVRPEGEPDRLHLTQRIKLGHRDLDRAGEYRAAVGLHRTFGGDNQWQLALGNPS